MEEIIVDFTGVKTTQELHSRFIEPLKLEKPDRGMVAGYKYARNFSALWDLLYHGFGKDTCIILKGLDQLSDDFDEEVRITKTVFNRLQEKDPRITVRYVD